MMDESVLPGGMYLRPVGGMGQHLIVNAEGVEISPQTLSATLTDEQLKNLLPKDVQDRVKTYRISMEPKPSQSHKPPTKEG